MSGSTPNHDAIIIGQGLAGTALAWHYWFNGLRALVVDRGAEVTSSRVAAGLITPISGQKLVKTWRLEETWEEAVAFYRKLEGMLNESFFSTAVTLRIIENEPQQASFEKRLSAGEYAGWIDTPTPPLPAGVDPGLGYFGMRRAGRLHTIPYLEASRRFFHSQGLYATADIDLSQAIRLHGDWVSLDTLSVTARRLIICRGWCLEGDPFFPELRFKPAKGEILTVRIRGYDDPTVLHRGIWLARVGHEVYRCGSTYDWKDLSTTPTEAARIEIVQRLEQLLHREVEVLDQQAAVRPIHFQQYPVIGQHPQDRRLAYLNGLGSKGALYAPHYARRLFEQLQ